MDSMEKRLVVTTIAMFSVLLLTGCGGGGLDFTGCRSDADCKHERICVDGTCQNPDAICNDDEDCPAGKNCFKGQCTVCDADLDGFPASSCLGTDCDDHNPAISPSMIELCSDGLDNDCDGLTDPDSLCNENCLDVQCPDSWACDPFSGKCVPICSPHCAGRQCGPDGCGSTCGQCLEGLHCSMDGKCIPSCENKCDIADTRCVSNAVTICTDTDGDGCTEWSAPVPCPYGDQCHDGRCEHSECTDECVADESYCWDDASVVQCGQFDEDTCLEYSDPIPCETGFCNFESGTCSECYDQCFAGQQICWDEYSYAVCRDFNGDGCYEFGQPIRCENGFCNPDTGFCSDQCWDQCQWGEQYCNDDYSFVKCDDWNGDGCAEFGQPIPCENARCDWQTNRCADECYDECDWGERYCWDDRSFIVCGEFDADPCLEFGNPQRCPTGTDCDWNLNQCTNCNPRSCDDQHRECGSWNDGCGGEIYCGDCPTGMVCSPGGRCAEQGAHPGAGNDCDMFHACRPNWNAAWMCVENPGQSYGYCSYPCETDQDCMVDFPNGCCRQLAPGHKVCMQNDFLCQADGIEYMGDCGDGYQADCLPDMMCVELNSSQSACLITCDVAMGYCPNGGNCISLGDGAATGVCIPTGDGQFGDQCTYQDSCVSGLLCTYLEQQHPGYCNTMCSDFIPCPLGFDCVLDDGAGGTWCAELCTTNSDCARLGAWECIFPNGDGAGLCLPLP